MIETKKGKRRDGEYGEGDIPGIPLFSLSLSLSPSQAAPFQPPIEKPPQCESDQSAHHAGISAWLRDNPCRSVSRRQRFDGREWTLGAAGKRMVGGRWRQRGGHGSSDGRGRDAGRVCGDEWCRALGGVTGWAAWRSRKAPLAQRLGQSGTASHCSFAAVEPRGGHATVRTAISPCWPSQSARALFLFLSCFLLLFHIEERAHGCIARFFCRIGAPARNLGTRQRPVAPT